MLSSHMARTRNALSARSFQVIIWIVENGKLVKYERAGECLQCGACCNTDGHAFRCEIVVSGNGDGSGEQSWDEWEGHSILRSQGLWWYLRFSGDKEVESETCESFIDGKCAIHDDRDKQPAICHYWPVSPKDLHSGCGYRFEMATDAK